MKNRRPAQRRAFRNYILNSKSIKDEWVGWKRELILEHKQKKHIDMINTFDDFQVEVAKLNFPETKDQISHHTLGLTGEAGEVANKVKKINRDDNGTLTEIRKKQIRKELGGVMWYVAALCTELGFNLRDVCQENIEILKDREQRGVLRGDGDER